MARRSLMGRVRDAVFGTQPAYLGTGPNSSAGYQLNGGGIGNRMSGLGGGSDKGDSSFFVPDRIWTKQPLEVIYAQSWAAAKFVDIPVDDQLIRWRDFEDENDDRIEEYRKAESDLMIRDRVARAMKAARLYGTGLLCIVTKEAPLDTEFDPERIFPGDLVSVLPFDRFDGSVQEWDTDIMSPKYGEPVIYRVSTYQGKAFDIHASRVIRFDGCLPMSTSGWSVYDRDWGVSEVVRIIRCVMQDAALAGAITHLSQEASVPVIKTEGFKDALASAQSGNLGLDEVSVERHGERINDLKSVFRTMFLDASDEFERVSVSFAGLPDLMDRYAHRIASAAGIPATRFLGTSPVGMNATGESDMQNYAILIQAMQEARLRPALDRLDEVLVRHVEGASDEPMEYHFPSLIDLSDLDQAEVGAKWSQAISGLVTAAVIDENEAREALTSISEHFGELPPMDDEELQKNQPDIEMMGLEQTGEIEREKMAMTEKIAKQKPPASKDK